MRVPGDQAGNRNKEQLQPIDHKNYRLKAGTMAADTSRHYTRKANGTGAGVASKMASRTAILLLSAVTAFSSLVVMVPQSRVFAAETASVVAHASQATNGEALLSVQLAQATQATQNQLQLVKEDIVTSGATLRTYKWYASPEQQQYTDLRVLVIDLDAPYVELGVMNGRGGKLNSRQSVLGMARETKAVAGVNASFFHMNSSPGNPLGGQIENRQMTVSPLFLNGWYSFGITSDRQPVIGEYSFVGSVRAEDGEEYPLFGINKPIMWDENSVQSHTDSIFMYTSAWGDHARAEQSYFTPAEVLVVDGVVTEMSEDGPLAVSIPDNGYILRGEGKGREFLLEHVNVGDEIETHYEMRDRHTGEYIQPDEFQMLIGGHTLLVDNGQPSAFTANIANISGNSRAARTAVGYSADGRYVYLITADKYGASRGMTLAELQQAMVQLGVWKGLNLDGGGSTTMVARPLGDTVAHLANKPVNTTMRQVVNGIGVYTTAPEGAIKGLIMDSMPFLFVGEKAELNLRGYDEYYNPVSKVDVLESGLELSVTEGYGSFEDGYFIPNRKGKAVITVSKGNMSASTDVEIVDRKDIARLTIDAGHAPIASGSMLELTVTSQLTDGRSREVPLDAIQWKIEGFRGSVEDGVLIVEEVEEYATARLIATYDGLSTTVVLPTKTKKIWADFDTVMPPISLDRISPRAIVDYEITNVLNDEETGSNMLVWDYDFSEILQFDDDLPKIAFEFNGDEGVLVEGSPNELEIDIYGDGKSSEIFLEATDINGKDYTISLGKIDWTGWRTVNVDLSSLELDYPFAVRRLVQESPENPLPSIDRAFVTEEKLREMVDPRNVRGTIAVDNISFQSVNYPPQLDNKQIDMQIDNPTVWVDGEQLTIDQPPVVLDGSTMVPIRFIVEALEGEVFWNPDDNKVTLIRGNQYVEMWLNEPEMSFNGRKMKAPVAPTALNNRTLVPLRILSEQLGWEVYWDNDTRSIKLVGRQ